MTRKQLSKLETIRLNLVALRAEISADDAAFREIEEATKKVGSAYATGSVYLVYKDDADPEPETWEQTAERQHKALLAGFRQ